MTLLFFQVEAAVGFWAEIAKQGIAISVLVVILVFVIVLVTKILPTWERVKTSEHASQTAIANGLGQLANSQSQIATVLQDVAVDLKQSTEHVKILQRVNADSNETLANTMDDVIERLEKVELKNAEKSVG